MPRSPSRLLSKFRGCLPDAFLEGAGKRFGIVVAAVQGDVDHRLAIAECKSVGGPLQPSQLDILVDADPMEFGKLPEEMMLRERSDLAELGDAEIFR